MSTSIDLQRRRILGTTTATLALGDLSLSQLANAAQPKATAADSASFGATQQINAGDLNIAYVDVGPKTAPVAILLHGWPYDIQSYAEVTPMLVSKGYRVIVPYLRGTSMTQPTHEAPCRSKTRIMLQL